MTRSPLRVPSRLAVAALIAAPALACSDTVVRDGGMDAALEAAPCDATPPDGQVCETICYEATSTGLVPTPCELFCVRPAPGGTGPCFTPDGQQALGCTLYVMSDSPDQVLC